MLLTDLYQIWAPKHVLWSPWVKPVLFVAPARVTTLEIPQISWAPNAAYDTAIIVDMPGRSSAEEGLALAQQGYRPVPLYNGVCGPPLSTMIVDVNPIMAVLRSGADVLQHLALRSDAPPAFLLDSDRMSGIGKAPGMYDNRWHVFPQDMPSASFLIKQGIKRVIVRSDYIKDDLSHVLLRYQDEGIEIYLCTGVDLMRAPVSKPSRFKDLSYRFKVMAGLVRNATGGFGGLIPNPIDSNTGSYRGGRYG